jgi:hypothetical protein
MGDHFYKLLQPLFSLFWDCHVLDKKNIPLQGPAVFVSNHHEEIGRRPNSVRIPDFPVISWP